MDLFIQYIFTCTMIGILLLIVSTAIPFYGLVRNRLKGLFIGCLIQPVVVTVIILGLIGFLGIFKHCKSQSYHEEAMVTLRKSDGESGSHVWYLKADEECFYEYVSSELITKPKPKNDLFDIVPVDSQSVCVDDHITVTFDLKNRSATATDYDEPLEVTNVDWNKVQEYFSQMKH